MSIPPEIAWLIPILIPFILGFLVGAVAKKALKLAVVVVALIIVLIATGALSLTFTDLYDRAVEFLPKIFNAGSGWINLLPYSSIMFLAGLGIAIWKVRA